MSDLITTLPNFPAHRFSHLLPSLDRACITLADLLTLDAVDVAKRATVPTAEVRKLSDTVLSALHSQLGFSEGETAAKDHNDPSEEHITSDGSFTENVARQEGDHGYEPRWISTLDGGLDEVLSGTQHGEYAGGIPTGYVSEITGESATGKTTLLLTLLLSVQLSKPWGLNQSALYLSTEAALSTPRLTQLLKSHPELVSIDNDQEKPSLSRILSIQCPDLESQEHIIRYQVPVAIERHNIGLLVVDSIAANFRAEFDPKPGSDGSRERPGKAMRDRRGRLIEIGQLLRGFARKYDIAVVVANQVADRFAALPMQAHAMTPGRQPSQYDGSGSQHLPRGSGDPHMRLSQAQPFSEPARPSQPYLTSDPLTLDHQQRFFTGWGHLPPPYLQRLNNPPSSAKMVSTPSRPPPSQELPVEKNLKTPSLGLIWTNQLACRIALSKSPLYNSPVSTTQSLLEQMAAGTLGTDNDEEKQMEKEIRGWKRHLRVVFAGWVGPTVDSGGLGKQFEIWRGGVRSLRSKEEN